MDIPYNTSGEWGQRGNLNETYIVLPKVWLPSGAPYFPWQLIPPCPVSPNPTFSLSKSQISAYAFRPGHFPYGVISALTYYSFLYQGFKNNTAFRPFPQALIAEGPVVARLMDVSFTLPI
jgi:hypothetical protein